MRQRARGHAGPTAAAGGAISVVKPKGKAELVAELRAVRARVAELERHAAESKHAAEAARALAQVVREFVGARDLAQATERVAWTVVQFFGVHQSLLFRLEPTSASLVCVAAAGEGSPEKWVGWTLPAGAGVAGLAVTEGRPIYSSDLFADPRITLPEWKLGRVREEGFRSMLTVPLKVRGEAIGALTLADTGGRVFTTEETELLSAFADQAALALQHEVHHLESRRRQLLDFFERHAMRVGEELHHEILNTLCGYLATAIDEQHYAEAKKHLDALVADLRRIMNNLYPKDLETEGLLWTIHKRLDDAKDEMLHRGRECTVTFDCPPSITNETIVQSLRDKSHLILLYRIVLEAIINARKHSRATSIGVEIRSTRRGVVVIGVRDNGIGNGGPFAENVGLALMFQRAEEIGADLEYRAASPHGGTAVLIRLRQNHRLEAPSAAQVIAAQIIAAIKSDTKGTLKPGSGNATALEQ